MDKAVKLLIVFARFIHCAIDNYIQAFIKELLEVQEYLPRTNLHKKGTLFSVRKIPLWYI